MNPREIATSIKETLTMRQVAERYGFTPNSAGFVRCPFHNGDHQASLRIYDGQGGWCCFGCHKGGTVIDFVMQLFDEQFQDACTRINNDFSLGLPIGRKQTLRECRDMQKRYRLATEKIEREKTEQRQSGNRYNLLMDLWVMYDRWRLEYAPKSPSEPIDPRYVQAVKNIDYISYRIDTER